MRPVPSSAKPAVAPGTNRNFVLLTVGVVLGISILSFLPLGDKRMLHTKGRFHSWGHLFAFATVAFVALRAASSRQTRWLLFLGTLFFGLGIEVAQHIVYAEPVETFDILVDVTGVVLGSLAALWSGAPSLSR